MSNEQIERARVEALTKSRKGSFFEDVLPYETARQLAVLDWLNPSGAKVTHRSLIEHLLDEPATYTPNDFYNFFIVPGDIRDEIFDVVIFSMARLGEYLRYHNRYVMPDTMYPNLYIACSRDKKHYLALELTADETGLMHVLLSNPAKQAALPVEALTDDTHLQQTITTVYSDFVTRLAAREIPHRHRGGADEIGLITPVEPLDEYTQRLEQMLAFFLRHDVKSEIRPGFVAEKAGDTARRLQKLDMIFEGNHNLPRFFLRKVYQGIAQTRPAWETMPPIECAIHEQRFVDNGYLLMGEDSLQVVVISLDKFDDSSGSWELFLFAGDDVLRVELGGVYNVLDVSQYSEFAGEIPHSPHEPLSVTDAVAKWMDGFYVPGYIKTLLQVVEHRDDYVTDRGLEMLVRGWMAWQEGLSDAG